MQQGQIHTGTRFGALLSRIAAEEDVYNIVEIGTWNGNGSTKCIIEGILSSGASKKFITIESNKTQYDEAVVNLDILQHTNMVTALHGRVVEAADLSWFDHNTLDNDQQRWLAEDLASFETCPNVLSQLPETIDLLLLDGGEFSTYPEFNILQDRVTYIALDDTRALKCKKVLEELLLDRKFELVEGGSERNGYAVFKRILV